MNWLKWTRHLGIAGFAFFLIKGLVWLVIAGAAFVAVVE